MTLLNGRVKALKNLYDEILHIIISQSNVNYYLEQKTSFMKPKYMSRYNEIQAKIAECHSHSMECSRLLREIRELIKGDLTDTQQQLRDAIEEKE